jgi:hypothetical protein
MQNWNCTYWDSTVSSGPAGSRQLRAALTDDHAYGASYNVIWREHAACSKNQVPTETPHATQGACRWARAWLLRGYCVHCNLSVPCAWDSGSLSRPPQAGRTAAVLMPLWACTRRGSRRTECGRKGLSLNVEVGGRVGRGLGAMTGRRCLGLKMGRKQPAQSCTKAGMEAGFLYATETLPRTPHVMERVFRRGPDEHQGAIASSSGAC